MKTGANFGHMLIAMLGVALCMSNAASAAENAKNIGVPNQRTGNISGQLVDTLNNQVVYGAGETVTLTPLVASGSSGRRITTKADAEGRFVFQGVPAGQYEIRARIDWTTTYVEVDDDGISDRMYVDHSEQLVVRVQVKAHQTVKVTSFSAGETKDAFYAYGGSLSRPHHPLVTCR